MTLLELASAASLRSEAKALTSDILIISDAMDSYISNIPQQELIVTAAKA